MRQTDQFDKTELVKFHLYKVSGSENTNHIKPQVFTHEGKNLMIFGRDNDLYIYPLANPLPLLPIIIGLSGAGLLAGSWFVKEVKDASTMLYGLIALATISLLLLKWRKII